MISIDGLNTCYAESVSTPKTNKLIEENEYLKKIINSHKELSDLYGKENTDLKQKISNIKDSVKSYIAHSEGIEQLATTAGCVKTIWRNSLDNLLTIIDR